MEQDIQKRVQEDLKSGDPVLMKYAQDYLDSKAHQPNDAVLQRIRDDLESGDPILQDLAMKTQARFNQEQGWSSTGQSLARGAKGVAKGIGDLADFVAQPVRKGLEHIVGSEIEPLNIGKHIDRWTDNYTVPTSKGQKVSDAMIEGLSTLPGIGTAGKALGAVAKGSKSSRAAKMLEKYGELNAQNIGSTAGASAASQMALNAFPDNPLLALGTGLVGGVGGGAGAHKFVKPLRIDKKALQAFQEAGIPYGLADISKSKAIHALKDSLPRGFGSQTIMDDYINSQIKGVQRGLGNLGAHALGDEKGTTLAVKGMSEHFDTQRAKHSRRYDKNRANIQRLEDQSVPLHKTEDWLSSLDPEVRKDLMSGSSKTKKYLHDILEKKEGASELDYDKSLNTLFSEMENAPVSLRNYPYVERKLTEIGSHLKTDTAQKNYTEAELSHLWGLVKQDAKEAIGPRMKALGDDAYRNWESVGQHYKEYSHHDTPYINKLLGEAIETSKGVFSAEGREPEILKVLMDKNTGSRTIAKAMEGLHPSEKKQLSQYILKNLGMRQGEFVPFVMHTNLSKMPQSSKSVLLKALPHEERKVFIATQKAIKNSKHVRKQANFSNSGHQLGAYQDMQGYADFIKAALGKSSLKDMLAVPVKMIGRNVAARAITSPKIADWASKINPSKKFDLKRSLIQPGVLPKEKKKHAAGGCVHGPMLQQILDETASRGRGGDTELAEITPHTASILDDLIHGGHKQINPETGLREYAKYKCYSPGCGKSFPTELERQTHARSHRDPLHVSEKFKQDHALDFSDQEDDNRANIANRIFQNDTRGTGNVSASTRFVFDQEGRKHFNSFVDDPVTQNLLKTGNAATYTFPPRFTGPGKSMYVRTGQTGGKRGSPDTLTFTGKSNGPGFLPKEVAHHFVRMTSAKEYDIPQPSKKTKLC